MKKFLTVILSVLALSSICFAGCKGESENSSTEDNNITEQNIIREDEGNGDTNEDTERLPDATPRMPDKRHNNRLPEPKPNPHRHHHTK